MALTPREVTRATNINVLSTSIVNPSVFLSLAATINGNTVVFLVDTGSALTILQKDIWERCKGPEQQLEPWCQKRLVGVEGSFLQVFGSATVAVNIHGEILQVAVVVIDPLTIEAILGLDILSQCTVDLLHKKLITGAGHVVTLCCQEPNMEWTTDLVDVGTVNSGVTVNSESKEHHVSQQDVVTLCCQEPNMEWTTDLVDVGTVNSGISVSSELKEHHVSQQDLSNMVLSDIKLDSVTSTLSQEGPQTTRLSQSEFMSGGSVPQEIIKTDSDLHEPDHVFLVKVVDNVRVPSYSEMEIMAKVKGCTLSQGSYYVLENNLHNSEVIVARALVTPDEFVPVRLLNPTDKPIVIYSGANVAIMSEISEVKSDDFVSVSAISQQDCNHALEEVFQELVKHTYLSSHQQDLLLALLLEYSDVFAISKDQLGRTDVLQHEIVTENVSPIRQKFRRMSPHMRAEMRVLLNDMLQKDIISPSKSPWASPIVLVKKKDGTSRFCVDYRQINAVTRKDAYPLPRVDDTLETLAGSQLFSTLDLISGYWQVEVKPEDREKIAFVTSEGLYEFNVLPFGLCNGPATFQRLMNILLAGIQWHNCLVYINDIIVLGRTFDEHLKNLAQVFQRLRDANLRLQVWKCQFCRDTVKFLGHVISPAGITTDPEKIAKVLNWPTPVNKQEIQQFMGLVNYYRRFIKNCSEVSKPLSQLTERNRPFKWTVQCQESFEALRRALASAPVLVFPDFSQTFIVDTDASNHGIGAVLSQTPDIGGDQEQVVAYASRTLTKSERRYSTTRKELLAVITFFTAFQILFIGTTFCAPH